VLADSLDLVEELIAEAAEIGWTISGIGVGVAELVDLNGNVTSAHTIDWRAIPVQAAFSRLAPAVVESDVRAPALAEAIFGAGRAYRLFVYITVGTGISCCLVQDGRPYAGARGNALIMASSPLTTVCTECGAVLKSVLEEFASGPALAARYQRQRSEVISNFGTVTLRGEDVLAAVTRGDTVAIQVVKTAGEALGNSVGWLINVLDPEAVIVGGGLGLAGGLYWDSFVSSTREHIWSDLSRALPILPAALGADAGLIGAAATIWQKL
jgi:glucokinase